MREAKCIDESGNESENPITHHSSLSSHVRRLLFLSLCLSPKACVGVDLSPAVFSCVWGCVRARLSVSFALQCFVLWFVASHPSSLQHNRCVLFPSLSIPHPPPRCRCNCTRRVQLHASLPQTPRCNHPKGVCLLVHRVSFSTTNANEDTSVGREVCTSARASTVALLRLLAAFALLRAEEGGGRDLRGGHVTLRASGSGTCTRRRRKEEAVCHCSTSQVPTQHRHIRRVTQTSTCLDVDATREQEEG